MPRGLCALLASAYVVSVSAMTRIVVYSNNHTFFTGVEAPYGHLSGRQPRLSRQAMTPNPRSLEASLILAVLCSPFSVHVSGTFVLIDGIVASWML